MTGWRAVCAGLALAWAGLGQTPEEGAALLARAGERYSALAPGVVAKVRVHKRRSFGDTWQETDRAFQYWSDGLASRVEVKSNDGPRTFVLRPDGTTVVYSEGRQQHAEHAKDDPAGQPVREAMKRIRELVLQRWIDLPASEPAIRSVKAGRLKAGGASRECWRLGLKGASWTSTIWVERSTALVWRSELSSRWDGVLTEETMNWEEIAPAAAGVASNWKPPASSTRVPVLPYVFPPLL